MIILSTAFFVQTPQDLYVKRRNMLEKLEEFDIPGTTLLTASFFCLIFALQLGGSTHWGNSRVIALFVLFAVLFLGFILWQFLSKRGIEPAMSNYNVWLTSVYAGCISGGMFIPITYMPVWFQAVRGASAFRSGVMITPLIVSFVVMSIISGVSTELIGYYNPAMIFGVILSAIGSGLLTTLKPWTSHRSWIGFQVLYGLGAGAGVPPPMLVIQTVLKEKDVPMGVAIVSLSQMLWSSVVVAIAQPIFETKLRSNVIAVLPGLDVEKLSNIGARDLALFYPADQLSRLVPAYSDAILKVFFITAALSCLAFPCALAVRWRSMKKDEKQSEVIQSQTSNTPDQALT
jgi:MFS family permease